MNDMNNVILIGRLTKDVDFKYLQSGKELSSFSLAVNSSYGSGEGKKEKVSFFNCTMYGKSAEIFSQYAHKGSRVCVQGKLDQRTWDNAEGKKQYAIDIIVNGFQFLDGKKDSQSEGSPVHNEPENNPFDTSSIPF